MAARLLRSVRAAWRRGRTHTRRHRASYGRCRRPRPYPIRRSRRNRILGPIRPMRTAPGCSVSVSSEEAPGRAGAAKEQSMRFGCALLGVALFAVPAAAQPFIVPLQQHQSEPPPAPSPAPVAPPQSGTPDDGRPRPTHRTTRNRAAQRTRCSNHLGRYLAPRATTPPTQPGNNARRGSASKPMRG